MIVNKLCYTIQNAIILDNLSFSLTNSKVGLVGVNGSGKSTLLKVLAGELSHDSGSIKLQDQTIGYLKQEIDAKYNELSVIEYIKCDLKLDVLEERLHELEENLTDDNMDEYSDVLNQFLMLDGYNINENAKIILNGLNYNKELDKKIKELSGGEKIKVLLAVLILTDSDILLLDEPTNNLDLDAILWIENYLTKSNKSMIIVSHDEDFLNNIVDKIFELSNGKIKEYNLSYDDYLQEKELEYEKEHDIFISKKEEVSKLKRQIQKASEWSTKGTSSKKMNDNDKLSRNYAKETTNSSLVSKLNKSLSKVDIPDFEEKKPISVFFELDEQKGNKNIIIDNLICGYKTFKTPCLDFQIPFGKRLQIIGGNGSGKTTFIKTLLGEIKPLDGEVILGHGVKIGYISQETLKEDNELSIIDYIKSGLTDEDIDISYIYTLLHKFNIEYDDKDKLYKHLSPGERTRINLVKLALQKTNVLVLDEVTNHLDKEALDLIYELLENYSGTIISISHNRRYNEKLKPDMVLDIKSGDLVLSSNKKNFSF